MPDKKKGFNRAAIICSSGAVFVAFLGLLGWIPSLGFWGNISPHFIPMAPTTSICFILLGLIVLIQIRHQLRGWSMISAVAVTLLLSVFGLIELAELFTGIDVEDFFVPDAGMLGLMRKARMSPATGGTFFISGVVTLLVLFKETKKKRINRFCGCSGIGGGLIVITGLTILLSYLYGDPLFYKSQNIPMAATTAIGFIFLGVGLLAAAGPDCMPVCLLAGESSRARMLKVFLPLSILIVLSQDILHRFAFVPFHINSALLDALSLTLFAVITGVIVTVMSGAIGRTLNTAEEALQESEKKYRTLFEKSSDAILIIVDDKFVDCNQATVEMLGYSTKSELLDTHPSRLSPELQPDGRSSFEKANEMMSIAFEKGSHRFEWDHKRCNGQIFPVEVLLTAIDGVSLHVVWRDITERKQAEDVLYMTQYSVDRAAFEVLWVTEDAHFAYVNDAACKSLGYTQGELLGLTIPDIDPDFNLVKWKAHWQELKQKKVFKIETRHRRKDGSVFPIEVTINYLEYNGVGYNFAYASDITKRKQAEELLLAEQIFTNTIIQSMPGLFYIFEKNSVRFIRRNDNWLTITGYSDDELDTMTALDFFEQGEDRSLCAERIQEVYDRGWSSMENLLVTKTGEQIPYYFTGTSLVIDDKTYLVGLGLDISDRKKTEQERKELLKTLIAKNKELQSIVYIASHDLKSPLLNISGYSAMLNESCKDISDILKDLDLGDEAMQQVRPLIDENIPECLKFISAGASKMKVLLNGLLQVSRVGTMNINIEPLNISRIISNICDAMEFQINKADVEVTFGNLPNCLGDENMINQLFSNLLGNAIKYLDPDRKGKVRITGIVENFQCVYCIEDNGIGIAADHQSKIFELFHRLNPNDIEGGEGIGLTIVTRVLERTNGSIRVESEPGKGSRFIVSLPAV